MMLELCSPFNCVVSAAKHPKKWKLANAIIINKDKGDAKKCTK